MADEKLTLPEVPEVRDKRPPIERLLPKNVQAWILGGIALVMVIIIMFSSRSAPKDRPPAASATPGAAVEANQGRIQEYRARIDEEARKLAAEEAQMAQTKEALGLRPAGPATTPQPIAATYMPSPERSWIETEREKREYQAAFASNIALSYRSSAVTGISSQPATLSPVAKEPSPVASPEETDALSAPKHRLLEGTIIETVLTNRLDGTFSGPVNCMVTTNVYSHERQHLLIPQGTRMLGEARKLGGSGEERLAVVFHRMIMPDGVSVSLDKLQGLSQVGETGLSDQINHHYLQIFGASIAIGALAGLSQANTQYGANESAADAYRQGVASSLSQSSLHILDRFLNVVPTVTIREGQRVKVYLSQDLMLPAYDQHPVSSDF